MIKNMLISFLLLFNFLIYAQIEYTKDFRLKGEVKTIKTISYPLTIFNAVDHKGQLVEQTKPSGLGILSFNKSGVLVEEFEKHRYNDVHNKFIYDKNDSLIDIKFDGKSPGKRYYNMLKIERDKKLMNIENRLESLKYSSNPENIYNSAGELVKVFNKKNSNSNARDIATLDFFYTHGKLDSIMHYAFNGDVKRIHKYQYKNTMIEQEIVILFFDTFYTEEAFNFNIKGELIKKVKKRVANGTMKSLEIKEFSRLNMFSSIKLDSINHITEKESRQYDSEGNLKSSLKIVNRKNYTIKIINNYEYDFNSNLVTEIRNFSNGTKNDKIVKEYSYKYDDNGNWIVKCSCKDELVVLTTVRQIEYYTATKSDKQLTKNETINFCDKDFFERLEKLKKEIETSKDIEEIEKN
ncbi:hypothetical protein GCM10022393_13550 [Aquimarina addita]|uniref:YD repeat-containing protein n=1 Tax=Aquimarina addita TaxID=870485 RepID=A0ABP7XF01_9FLAO